MNIEKFEAFIQFINVMNDGDQLYVKTTSAIRNWFCGESFNSYATETLKILLNLDISAYSGMDNANQIIKEIKIFSESFDPGLIGHALAPYLIIWNIRRFSAYLCHNEYFSLKEYFDKLGNYLSSHKVILKKGFTKNYFSEARIQIISATVMDWRGGEASC